MLSISIMRETVEEILCLKTSMNTFILMMDPNVCAVIYA